MEEEETDVEESFGQVNMLCACDENSSQRGDSEYDPNDFMTPYNHGSEDMYLPDVEERLTREDKEELYKAPVSTADEEQMGPMRHLTQPVICSMVSTLSVEQHRNENLDQSTVDAMICKVCGDVPKPFARPPGKVKPAKLPKTLNRKRWN